MASRVLLHLPCNALRIGNHVCYRAEQLMLSARSTRALFKQLRPDPVCHPASGNEDEPSALPDARHTCSCPVWMTFGAVLCLRGRYRVAFAVQSKFEGQTVFQLVPLNRLGWTPFGILRSYMCHSCLTCL